MTNVLQEEGVGDERGVFQGGCLRAPGSTLTSTQGQSRAASGNDVLDAQQDSLKTLYPTQPNMHVSPKNVQVEETLRGVSEAPGGGLDSRTRTKAPALASDKPTGILALALTGRENLGQLVREPTL